MEQQTTPQAHYSQRLKSVFIQIKSTKKTRNLLTVLKLISFIGILYFLYLALNLQQPNIFVISLILLHAFLAFNVIDSKVSDKLRLLIEKKNHFETELEYIKNNFSKLKNGSQHTNHQHNYSHDLDLFGEQSFFQRLNRTVTNPGEVQLAHELNNPFQNEREIEEKQQAIAEIAKHPLWIEQHIATGKAKTTDTLEWKHVNHWVENDKSIYKPRLKYLIYLSGILNAILLLLWIFTGEFVPFILLSLVHLGIAGYNLKNTNKVYVHLEKFYSQFTKYKYILEVFKLFNAESTNLKLLRNELIQNNNSALHGINKLARFTEIFDQRLNILVTILLNALFMHDLIIVQKLASWKKEYKSCIVDWTKQIAELDTLISKANYAFNHPNLVFPELSNEPCLHAEGLGHPHLNEETRVNNDIHIEKQQEFWVVTGANMAGKSTFLRTVGINLVMAMIGLPVAAKKFRFKPVYLFTSMRTTDNLATGYSYFHAELHRLSELMQKSEQHANSFVILDELLKGTNSVDKLNGSLKFLEKIKNLSISGIIATHDLGLGELAEKYPDNFSNYCFEIKIDGDNISYDYKIEPGISKHMNATLLMQRMNLI
jgi:DNA mismatch repair ATPase MutS